MEKNGNKSEVSRAVVQLCHCSDWPLTSVDPEGSSSQLQALHAQGRWATQRGSSPPSLSSSLLSSSFSLPLRLRFSSLQSLYFSSSLPFSPLLSFFPPHLSDN